MLKFLVFKIFSQLIEVHYKKKAKSPFFKLKFYWQNTLNFLIEFQSKAVQKVRW